MQTNQDHIQQIRERLQRIDNGEVNFNWHNWSSGDIRVLLAEIDRLDEIDKAAGRLLWYFHADPDDKTKVAFVGEDGKAVYLSDICVKALWDLEAAINGQSDELERS